MKSDKKLKEIYDEAKGDNTYYSFDDFKKDAKEFLKDIKKRNVVMSMKVSRSGMTRRFNVRNFNMLLNVCYNQKFNWDEVKVGGCGMDMMWYFLFSTCERLTTRREIEKYHLNSKCSHQILL